MTVTVGLPLHASELLRLLRLQYSSKKPSLGMGMGHRSSASQQVLSERIAPAHWHTRAVINPTCHFVFIRVCLYTRDEGIVV